MYRQAHQSQPFTNTPAPDLMELLAQDATPHEHHHLLEWWHRLAAPSTPPVTASLEQREAYRRAHLTSTILLTELGTLLLVLLFLSLFDAHWLLLPNYLATLLLLGSAGWLNRRAHPTSAGILIVCTVELSLTFVILATPVGLTMASLSFFDLLVVGELLAASLLPACTVFVVALVNILFILAILFWMPRTVELTALVQSPALVTLLVRLVSIHGTVALILYLWVQSARRALRSAERATALAIHEHTAAARASQLEATFEAMADGVAVYDLQGHPTQINATLRRLLRGPDLPTSLAQEEWATLLSVVDEQGQPFAQAHSPLSRLLRGDLLIGDQTVDLLMRTGDGNKVHLNASGAPVRSQTGSIVGAVLVYRDVTEQRRLQQRTRQSLDRLLAMAEALVQIPNEQTAPKEAALPRADLVMHRLATLTSVVLGCQGVSIATLNVEQNVFHLLVALGLPLELQRPWWTGERHSARWLDSLSTLIARLQAGETLVLDMSQPSLSDEPNPDGARIVLVVPMRIGERLIGLLSLGTMQRLHRYTADEIALAETAAKLCALVIERKRLLRECEEANAKVLALAEANERMDTFLNIASHELKTPVTSLQLYVQGVQRRLKQALPSIALFLPDVAKVFEILQKQYAQAEQSMIRLTRLVDNLLDTSRIQAGQLELCLHRLELVALVKQVVEEHRQFAPTRRIHLSVPVEDVVYCWADADRLGQVVTNLLSNALKFSAEARPVTVGLEVEGGLARVWVHDEGPGISEVAQRQL